MSFAFFIAIAIVVASCSTTKPNFVLNQNALLYSDSTYYVPYVGKSIEYYPTGEKKEEYTYLNGKREGAFTGWYQSGKKSIEGSFINNKKNGIWIWYDENGNIRSKMQYDKGVIKK